jgi:hypothetical protein
MHVVLLSGFGSKDLFVGPNVERDRPVASRYCCARGGSALITLLFTSSTFHIAVV